MVRKEIKMKQILTFLATLILIFTLAACGTTGSTATTGTTEQQSATAQSSAATNAPASTYASAEQALAENKDAHDDPGDEEVDLAAAIPVALDGDSISASGEGIRVEGSTVTITAAGDYRLSGSLDDGQIEVNATQDDTVRLIFDGVRLNNTSTAPIHIVEADKVILYLVDGTTNTISDAAEYVYATADVDEPNAAVFSKADLSIYGGGALTVNGAYMDGITSKDGLVIAGGNITVTAADDGIRGKDYVVVSGGALSVTAGGDGLKSDDEEDVTRGYIQVSAGTLAVTSGGDALSAQTDVIISGGDFTLSAGGGSSAVISDDSSAKGIKGDVGVVIDGGTFVVDAADDAIHSNGSITVNNGTFTLATADDGVHADEKLMVNGGELEITQSYEGLESAVISINGGTIHVAASDDGINVGGGNDGSAMMGPGGRGGPNPFAASGDYFLYINDGYIYVDAYGDGLDINGAIEMTGGTVLVNGPTEQMNGAIDYDGGFKISGGLLIATGSSGMAMAPDQNSTQNAALIFLDSTQPGGSLMHLQDSSGKEIITFMPTRAYQSIAISSPDLVKGETYTVYTGGSSTGAAVDGLYQGGVYSPGDDAASFTINSIVTTAGSGGRQRPGGGPRGPRGGPPPANP